MSPWKLCIEPGCTIPAAKGGPRCEGHRKAMRARADAHRPTAAERGYRTPDWRATRAIVLARDQVCRWGSLPRDGAREGDCAAASTDAAHIVPRPHGSDEPDNARGLCHAHHSRETATRDGGFGRPSRP